MSIQEFLNIYRPTFKLDRMIELSVWVKPIFIYLCPTYSNNKYWRQQTFRVSGRWEFTNFETLPEDQRVPKEWAPMFRDLREPPELEALERRKVDTMLHFSREWRNFDQINFDNIVTDTNMRNILGYQISENKAPYEKGVSPRLKRVGPSPRLQRRVPRRGGKRRKSPVLWTRGKGRCPKLPSGFQVRIGGKRRIRAAS